MKSIFLSAFFAITLFASASGTKEKKTVATYRLSQNFQAEFGHIENVKWSSAMNNMTKADFVMDDENICAYFDENGDYVASTRVVSYDDLPKKLKASIQEKLPSAKIETVFEMSSPSEKAWFVETSLNNEKKVWKGNIFGTITRYYLKP